MASFGNFCTSRLCHTLSCDILKYHFRPTLTGLFQGPSASTAGGDLLSSDAQQSPIGKEAREGR